MERRPYRPGLATTRAQARQLVVHRHVDVNGSRVDRPSYEVAAGDVISIRDGSRARDVAAQATELAGATAPWLLADPDKLQGTVLREPTGDDIPKQVDER